MPTADRIDLASATTLAGLSRHRTRLLRELQEVRSRSAPSSLHRLEAELLAVEHQMTLLIGIDRRADLFEPRLARPHPAQP